MENTLKEKHEKSGKSYPRPSILCDSCQREVILCWGEKHPTPYFRHKGKREPSLCSGGGEGALHRLAKEQLCDYLNHGGLVKYRELCKKCGNTVILNIPSSLEWKLEVTYRSIRFDIAAMNGDSLLMGIEIHSTHRAENTEIRDEIKWIEVNCNEVLKGLVDTPEVLLLQNIRTIYGCQEPKCVMKKEVLTFNTIEEKALISCHASDLITEEGKMNVSYQVSNRDNLSETYIEDGVTPKTLSLLYLRERIRNDGISSLGMDRDSMIKILENIMNHEESPILPQVDNDIETYMEEECYQVPYGHHLAILLGLFNGDLGWSCIGYRFSCWWDEFLRMERCCRCMKLWNTTKEKPYCIDCFRHLTVLWKREERNIEELTIKDIAEELGYFHPYDNFYETKERKNIDIAIRGAYKVQVAWDMTPYYEKSSKTYSYICKLWDVLCSRDQCIRCEEDYIAKKGKPYCEECFIYVLDTDFYEEYWVRVPENIKKKYRKRFSWLNDVPVFRGECYLCGMNKEDSTNDMYKEYWNSETNSVQLYTWWFGENKACCTICLEKNR